MGFYFRKSINFGGIRFNFSKSSIGTSTGFKGFRIGTSPKGNYVHMGRNGTYYRMTLGRNESKKPSGYTQRNFISPTQEVFFSDIESKDVSLIIDSSSQEIVNEITTKRNKFSFWPLSFILSFIPVAGIFLAILSGILLYFLVDKKRKTTVILYDIEEHTENEIQQFYDSFDEIISCQKIWHVSAQSNIFNRKYQAGASSAINRSEIKIRYKNPSYIKTNVKIPMIPIEKQKLYFFPDKVFIFDRKKVGSLSYSNLNIIQHNQRFIEKGSVPKDGTIIDYTWQYVNESGGPDMRFKNNIKIPILMYSEMLFSSDTGLNELIQLSKENVGSRLVQQLNNYKTKPFFNT